MAYARHPLNVDFIKKHHIEKWVGTFDDEFAIDPESFTISVLVNGVMEPIEALTRRTTSRGDVLIENHQKLFYMQGQGIIHFDPEEQRDGTIPAFRVKSKQTLNEYYLEVQTIVDATGTHNHAFMTLHASDGTERSMGYFRVQGQEQEWGDFMTTTKASLASPDRYEFMRLDKYRKRTVIPLTKAQHSEILVRVAGWKKVYNPINQNCLSMMKPIIQEVTGVKLETKSSLLRAYTGVNLNCYFIMRYFPPARIFTAAIIYSLAVVRNLVFVWMGAFNKHEGVGVFNHWYDVFNPRKGMPDHPRALRDWQVRVERSGTLPLLADAEKRDAWWYAKDLVWAQDERDGLVDMA